MSNGWAPQEQLDGVWAVLKGHTNGVHSSDCKARAYECVWMKSLTILRTSSEALRSSATLRVAPTCD